MPTNKSKVFISYLREDAATVDLLAQELRNNGVEVWLDRNSILGGGRWKDAIRRAIANGSAAIVCFSSRYYARTKGYMNEELVLLVEELRLRSGDSSWFIPVRLDDCEIPDRRIGAGETLRDLQRIDLFSDWDTGIAQILSALSNP